MNKYYRFYCGYCVNVIFYIYSFVICFNISPYWRLLETLLNHYMFIEVMSYLHDNKWRGSQLNAFKDPLSKR